MSRASEPHPDRRSPAGMMTPLEAMTIDHKRTLSTVAQAVGMTDPIAFYPDSFQLPLMKHSTGGDFFPLEGVLIRDWDRDCRHTWPGIYFGFRVYRIEGVKYVRVSSDCHGDTKSSCYEYFVVDRSQYAALYRQAKRCQALEIAPGPPPVLAEDLLHAIRRNTIDFLEPKNLTRIQSLGGRPKRGLLLAGPPGNGKTSACRWIWQQCQANGLDYRIVSPDDYRSARQSDDPSEAIKQLFTFARTGVVFFDDLDIALRDRDKSGSSDDQSVFLGALDGIEVQRGVVTVFTTNLTTDFIDRAFLRPGRIDCVLHFPKPTRELRWIAINRWNDEIQKSITLEAVLDATDNLSFAELDELKNLLIVGYLEHDRWDWSWAWNQFRTFRKDGTTAPRVTGFAPIQATDRETMYPTHAQA